MFVIGYDGKCSEVTAVLEVQSYEHGKYWQTVLVEDGPVVKATKMQKIGLKLDGEKGPYTYFTLVRVELKSTIVYVRLNEAIDKFDLPWAPEEEVKARPRWWQYWL